MTCRKRRKDKYSDLIGKKFNNLTVVNLSKIEGYTGYVYYCKCDCGGSHKVRGNHLVTGFVKTCTKCPPVIEDHTGEIHHGIEIIKPTNNKNGRDRSWLVKDLATEQTYVRQYRKIKKGFKKPDLTSFRTLFNNTHKKAIKRKIDFELSYEEYIEIIKKNCYYCGSKPSQVYKNAVYNGIDRTENNLGYTKENSVACCWPCNRFKGTLSVKEFIELARKIVDHNK